MSLCKKRMVALLEKQLNIHKITVKNFKNISSEEGEIGFEDLNVFLGPNGSGKSNLLGVLQFLADCVAGNPSAERGVTAFDEAIEKLGGARIIDGAIKLPADVFLFFEFGPTSEVPKGIKLELDLRVNGRTPFINGELLYDGQTERQQPFYYYKCHDRRPGRAVVSVYGDKGTETHFETLEGIPSNKLALTNIAEWLEESKYSPEQTPLYKNRRKLIENISQWRFYNANDMDLGRIRRAEPQIGPTDTMLDQDCENLARVMDNLIQQHLDYEENIQNAMKAILPETRKVRAVRSGRLSLSVEWYVEGIREPFYLDGMSDGTVRMLCWAVLLKSPILPTLLVIDEPELSIHPAWMPILADWIKEASHRTKVIICTHSPDLLDNFTDSVNKVFCFTKCNGTHFSVEKLQQAALQPKIDEGWLLGDLYRVGDPAIKGWPW